MESTQTMMKKCARVMENDPRVRSTEDPISPKQIELIFLKWCGPPAGNPHWCALLAKLLAKVTLISCRMVREESFTSLAKLGSGKVESFTIELISRVCLVKTPKCMGSLARSQTSK
jgi:hypothetical protein